MAAHTLKRRSAQHIDVAWALKTIRDYNSGQLGYTEFELAESILKHLGYEVTDEKIDQVIGHLSASSMDMDFDKFVEDKNVIYELFDILNATRGSKKKAYFMKGDQIKDPNDEKAKVLMIKEKFIDDDNIEKYKLSNGKTFTYDMIEKFLKVGRDPKLVPNIHKDKQPYDNPSKHGFDGEARPDVKKLPRKGSKKKANVEAMATAILSVVSENLSWENTVNEIIDQFEQEGGNKAELLVEIETYVDVVPPVPFKEDEVEWLRNRLTSSKKKADAQNRVRLDWVEGEESNTGTIIEGGLDESYVVIVVADQPEEEYAYEKHPNGFWYELNDITEPIRITPINSLDASKKRASYTNSPDDKHYNVARTKDGEEFRSEPYDTFDEAYDVFSEFVLDIYKKKGGELDAEGHMQDPRIFDYRYTQSPSDDVKVQDIEDEDTYASNKKASFGKLAYQKDQEDPDWAEGVVE